MPMSQPSRRVFATADIGANALQLLRQAGYDLEVYPAIEAPPYELILAKVQAGIDGLITTLRDRIDEPLLAAGAAAGLKVIAQDAVGFDNIDRAAANRHRIPFTNTPGVLTDATAEFAFFMMGAVSRKLWPSEKLVRENRWGAWHPYHPMLGDEVSGKTVAVVGTGRIGQALIVKCLGFAMDVICVEPAAEAEAALAEFMARAQQALDLLHTLQLSARPARLRRADLPTALAEADYVSLHVPLVRPAPGAFATYHLINDETLGEMKPSAYLINTARGPVVDEAALARALLAGQIAGAALDVFETEPLPAASPLRDPRLEDRLRLFPHFASGGTETRLSTDPNRGMAGRCVQALRDVIEGHYDGNPAKMPWVVNKEAFA